MDRALRGRLLDLRVNFFCDSGGGRYKCAETAKIIAENFYQVGAGGDLDGATIFVNIGKWCAERIFVEVLV